MTPYADFTYFGLLLYIVVPTIVLGLFGRANARWALLATVLAVVVQCSDDIPVGTSWHVREIWILLICAAWQSAVAFAFLRWKSRAIFYTAVASAIAPLVAAKWLLHPTPDISLGFGISYVTFRALDVVFSIHDGVLKTLSPGQYIAFVFFAPTISSGPIDRYRRFAQDWLRKRSRSEFLTDLDTAVEHIFRGFLYKFILAALISTHWVEEVVLQSGVLPVISYMYGYTLYLFFDFAGYSAFAIGLSYLLGVRTPENFNLPFLSRNIRDFWQRWHISLSFWFRDHVHMRFLLAAAKGKWFRGKHTANQLGLLLTFGLMGVWHGTELHYLLYGLYHAALLIGYDWFTRWNKQRKLWGETAPWRFANRVLTIHAVCFGLLLFSGRLTPNRAPAPAPGVEAAVPAV
ncbi:MAG TPA: D-alanyl-lipoteichoic acid biosynthesis protein DltB [Chthoniobacteraceae bacterium]|nr:D-alanyl-lipoteichoic acid biosynthesis protein DltB [Chthoniobacteraceae bacterium]